MLPADPCLFACHSYDLDVDVLARAGAAVRGEGHTFIQCGVDIVTSEGDTVARKASGPRWGGFISSVGEDSILQ